MLAGEILRYAAARFPNKCALVDGDRTMTYRAFDEAANRAAGALAALGLVKGARAAIIAPNGLEFPVLFYGAARAGIILAAISTRATENDLVYQLNKITAEILIFAGSLGGVIGAARRQVRSIRHVVAIGPIIGDAGPGVIPFDRFVSLGAGHPPAIALDEADPVAMTFTGGTTGFPKAVLATHAARYVTLVTCCVEFGLDERDIAIVATPLFHTAGLFVWFQPCIALGCTCVLMPSWDAEQFMALVESHRATSVLLVPTQLGDLINHPNFAPSRLATLRHISYAGSPMPVALLDRLQTALPRVAFTENYGQSETGPLTIRRGFHPHDKRASSGRPPHNVETRVVDSAGNEVPAGVVGDIVTRGPHLLKEYWGDPEQTAQLFRAGGWLWTGDLGVRDEDGFITLVDRAKDMIVSGGENLYPTEIENALFRHPAVSECAVFGIPDDRWGEVPAAHVVLHPGQHVTAEALVAFVETLIARYKRPRLIEFVASLPKTAIGKVQKNIIRARYWEGRKRKI